MNDQDFYEWFRGIADGEGNFDLKRKKGTKNFEGGNFVTAGGRRSLPPLILEFFCILMI
jgi:hypothetical protein